MLSPRTRTRFAAVLIIALPTVSGCVSLYVEATSTFAAATSSGVGTFVQAFDTASSLCLSRSRYDYLFTRILGQNDKPWSRWHDEHVVAGTTPARTWAEHCQGLANGDRMLLHGLQALTAYADALAAVADAGDYDGGSLTNVVTDATTLAAKISVADNPHLDTIKGLAGPIGLLASKLVQVHARRKLRAAIVDLAPAVDAILAAVSQYNDATTVELADAQALLRNVLDAADARLITDDPVRIIELHDAARRFEDELLAMERKQAAYRRVLAGLRSAQAALVTAAQESKTDEEAMHEVMGFTSEVLTQIEIIQSALGAQ